MPATGEVPAYDQLPRVDGRGPRCSWGVWGVDDVLGCLNLLPGPAEVTALRGLVHDGGVFPLDWDLELPDPPLFDRPALAHTVSWLAEGLYHDDSLSDWNTQASTQWDGFRHVAYADGGRARFYNGVDDGAHGVDHWARRGIVGRGVVVDVGRHLEAAGRPVDCSTDDPIDAADVQAALDAQGSVLTPGDILLVRTGWIAWYQGAGDAARAAVAADVRSPGLRAGEDTLRWLWDAHLAAVATDTPAFEPWPPPLFAMSAAEQGSHADPATFMHPHLLGLLGLPLGEMWDLDALVAACAADGRWECLLTSAPLHLRGGVASPPNALALR